MVKLQGDFHFSFGTSTKRSEQPQGDFFARIALQREPWFRVGTISTYTVATCGTFKIGWTTILQFDILHELHNKAKKYFNCNYSSHPLIRTSPSVMKKWSHRRRSRSISTISVYLKSSLIREVAFGWSDLIRGEITVVKV